MRVLFGIVIMLIFFLFYQVTVFFEGFRKEPNHGDFVVCGSYAVPGMFCYDLRGGTYDYKVLEEDSKGRVLFSYRTKHEITDEFETAIVILQTIKGNNVYFYEDVCWLIGEYTEDDITTLKEKNDWDKELNFDKMVKRKSQLSMDSCIMVGDTLDFKRIVNLCIKEFGIEESQVSSLILSDINENGYELRIFEFKADGLQEEYYLLVNPEYEISYMDAGDEPLDADTIVEFKKEFGWYGEED